MWLYFQSLVQYRVDSETGQVEVTKKFTSPIKGAQNFKRKVVTKELDTEEIQEEYL